MKNGRPLSFSIVVSPSPTRRQYAVLLQEQFKQIGAHVDVDQVDNPSAIAHQNNHDYDALLASLVAGSECQRLASGLGHCRHGPGRAELLAILEQDVRRATRQRDGVVRSGKVKRYTSQAFQRVIDDAPAIFLYDIFVIDGVNRRIITAPMRTDEWWANLADWSISPDKANRSRSDRAHAGQALGCAPPVRRAAWTIDRRHVHRGDDLVLCDSVGARRSVFLHHEADGAGGSALSCATTSGTTSRCQSSTSAISATSCAATSVGRSASRKR